MSISVLGLSYKTSPIGIRERIAFGADIVVAALRDLLQQPGVTEGVILSTCNRTEIYCNLDNSGSISLADWLWKFHGVPMSRVIPYSYTFVEKEAVNHILKVTCGLDSLVLGEPQILGQIKKAFQVATQARATGKVLGRLFQYSFSVAKQVRTDTAIGNNSVSVAFTAIGLAKQIFSDLSQQTALLIGAGETIELAAKYLKQNGIKHIIVANRTVERAQLLAAQLGGNAIALPEITYYLADADIVVSSTASPLPVLGKGAVESALKKRKHLPMLMIDLAVPRDIEPEVAELSDIYLYTIDDLETVVKGNLQLRQDAALHAQQIVDFHTNEFMGWLRSLDAVELIQAYRHQAQDLCAVVLERSKHMLSQGRTPEQALEYLAHTLTNKLLHGPSARLRQAGIDGKRELLQAANELLQLHERSGRDRKRSRTSNYDLTPRISKL